MPSTYAHYRLGQEVRQKLAGRQREVVEAWPELYCIGLHGPDILFYYGPLSSNRVNAVGHELHARSGRCFIENARRVVRGSRKPQAALAYAQRLEEGQDTDAGALKREIQSAVLEQTGVALEPEVKIIH